MKKLIATISLLFIVGCTQVSTKLAIDTDRDIDKRRDFIFYQMALNNKIYLYNKLKDKVTSSKADPEFLNQVWSEREGIERYAIEWERLRALDLVTVKQKLIADQSIFDIKYKNVKEYIEKAEEIKNEKNNSTDPNTPS